MFVDPLQNIWSVNSVALAQACLSMFYFKTIKVNKNISNSFWKLNFSTSFQFSFFPWLKDITFYFNTI